MTSGNQLSLWMCAALALGACGDDSSPGPKEDEQPPDPFADYTLDPEVYSTPPETWVSETPATGSPYSYGGDQVLILLNEGEPEATAEAVASSLGGSLVGQIPAIGLYQVRLATTGATAVTNAITLAEAQAGVTAAFHNLRGQVFATCPAECDLSKRQASPDQCPYRESEYFETLTVFDNIGINLSKVRIGIVDTGIRAGGELSGYPLLNADNPGQPIPRVQIDDGGTTRSDDSHGTAVASIMVSRDGGGGTDGINGLASRMLADKVELVWGGSSGPSQDPLVDAAGDAAAWMVSTLRVARAGAQVINMSYGWERGAPNLDKLAASFTRIMALLPETVFVVAAPSNQAYALDGTNAAPAGIALPNVITVGGTALCAPAQAFSASTTGSRIDVAASAYAWGVNVSGGSPVTLLQGNSYAAPQVSSLVALLRGIRPALPAAMVKTTYVMGKTFPTAASVSGRRIAFSQAALQLLVDQGMQLDLVDPNGTGEADPVGLVINRICGGIDYKIAGYGSHHIDTDDDEAMGFIYDTSFGFFATPTGQPYLEMGCDECTLDLAEYPVGDVVLPDQVVFGWQQGESSDVIGGSVSGTMSVDTCRIDERDQLFGGPFLVSVRAHFNGIMNVGPYGQVGPAEFDGAYNMQFAVGVLPPANVIDNLEAMCEDGLTSGE